MHNTASVCGNIIGYIILYAQHGFRSGRGTADCLFNLRRVVELAEPMLLPCMLPMWTSARPLTRSTTRLCGKCWRHEASTPS